jgi:hypothetical protein
MSEQIWYVYQNGQQLGPFAGLQIKQMADSKMIPHDAYLFKVGWKDWRPIEDCGEELGEEIGVELAAAGVQSSTADRREAAPRAGISGRVVVHNNGQLVIGTGVNISSTGIFVETRDQLFTVGEKLKLSVRVEGFAKAFNVVAQVIRYNADPRHPVGYGMCFEDLEDSIAQEIQRAVDHSNRAKGGSKAAR